MDRVAVKRQAADIIKSQKRPIMLATVLFLALILTFSLLSFKLTMPSSEDLLKIGDLASRGDYDGAMRLMNANQPAFRETMMSDLLSYLQAIVSFGYLMLMLGAVRGKEVSPGMLLDGFAFWVPVLLLAIVSRLLISALFFLLIVPGIIGLYNYRMSRYLLYTHPKLGVFSCLRESRIRMRGHRMELFRLDLSFLGWALLCGIPVIGLVAAAWALPRWTCASLLYYEAISASYDSAPAQEDGSDFPI